jgi:hypothetical protein
VLLVANYAAYAQLLCVCGRIRRQNEIIANAQRTVAETEEVGTEIMAELSSNREKIESARAKVYYALLLQTPCKTLALMRASVRSGKFCSLNTRGRNFMASQTMRTSASNRCGSVTRPGDCLVNVLY